MKKLIFIHVTIPLLLGGIIYISFRSLSLRMFDWFKWSKIDFFTSLIREILYPLKNDIPSWFYFSLPDGLWVYSFSSALLLLWKDHFEKAKYWLIIPLISGSIFEIAQGLSLFPGTFDILDLLFTSCALCLSAILLHYKFKNNDSQIF